MIFFHCKDCEKRTRTCHSTCEIYHQDKENWEKFKKKRKAERDLDTYQKGVASRRASIRALKRKSLRGYLKLK